MIELRTINEENYRECLALKASVENENFVDTVAYSLAEAWVYYQDTKPFGIYKNDELIGFVSMYVGEENYQIINFLIDDAYQGKGLGTEAGKVCISFLKKEYNANRISAPVELENVVAQKFWKKLGFESSDSIEDGYVFMRLELLGDTKMTQIELIEPSMNYEDEIWNFRQEIIDFDAESEDQFAGCLSLDSSDSAEKWIKICELRKNEATCEEAGTTVPSHMYLAVRKSDDRVVGVIDLRHHINHPILGTWGGHCGYSVRPSERGKGYAKEMLRLNIQNAKALGIPELLITCNVTNEASEKTILANGGVFEKMIDVDGTMMKRYWITVS